MTEAALAMSAELADELARNGRRKVIDPRTVPLRFHHLKATGQSPAHGYQSFQDDRWDTLALRLGKGTHAMLFGQPIAIWDQPAAKGSGRAPRNGKAWDAFRSANSHATVLNRNEHDKASRIVTSIRSHELASELLFAPGVLHESTINWTQDGRARRSTPDARGTTHFVELKTTRCAQPDRFRRDGMYRAYHAQLADQANAIEASTGNRPWSAYIVAVETVEPYVVQVMQLTQRALEQGDQLCRDWFSRVRTCEESGQWPGYQAGVCEFDIPDERIDLRFDDDTADIESEDES
ncbi:MAG: PD-(D/E)XK nuclease-like domain-containing protein [Tepidisphaeraceae bacterium]